MGEWFLISGVLVLLIVLGWLRLRQEYHASERSATFVHEYYSKFGEFTDKYFSRYFDSNLYVWLTQNVHRIHHELGDYAILDYFTTPRQVVENYPLFINTLPQFRSVIADERALREQYKMCQDALLRGSGAINDKVMSLYRELHAPLTWLREGVRFLFAFPFHFLSWSGLDRYGPFRWLSYSGPGKFATFVGWILTWIVAFEGFIADWQPFASIVRNWLGK